MNRNALIALTLLALGLGGCRSDGGFGRADSERGLAWTADTLGERWERDVRRTESNLEGLGDWLSEEVSDPLHELRRTWVLYTEGTAEFGEH